MILGKTDDPTTPQPAAADMIVGRRETMAYDQVLIPKLSVLADGGGSGSGTQMMRGALWNAADELVAVTEEVEIANGDGFGWHDLNFAEFPTWTNGEQWAMGVHFGGVAEVARYVIPEDNSGFNMTDTYSDGTPDLSAESAGEGPLITATFIRPVDLRTMDDLYYARLGHYSAQELLGTGATETVERTVCGWHGTWLDPEPQGASFAVVDREGDLADLVGERIRVSAYGRSVVAYVHRATELDSGDVHLSLSRRAFAALAVLSTEELRVKVEVLS
jgi:hypothetical protein